jgi:hypothetical protein
MTMWLKGITSVLAALMLCACVHVASAQQTPPTVEQAWALWRAGDVEAARAMGEALGSDEGRHIVALAAHVRGDHAGAIAAFEAISPDYPRRRELRGPIFESFLHAGDFNGALAFATQSEMSANARARAQARIDNPIAVTIPGVVGLGFEQDALTPHMPGVAGQVNGREAVFRFDTGGTFVAMSPALATRYGVRSDGCAQGFANLQPTQVCYGVADIALGPVRVVNAPVAVVSSLPSEQLGVELGPVLGTNFLERFLVTIDAPNGRLVMSPRGHAVANAQHLAFVGGARVEVPFQVWGDHLIIARGVAGDGRQLNLFVDSGLVALGADGVQAGFLIPQTQAATWAGLAADASGIQALPVNVGFEGLARGDQSAMILPDSAWAAFGTFGGIEVSGVMSYGYLKHYAWTLDFERRVIVLSTRP